MHVQRAKAACIFWPVAEQNFPSKIDVAALHYDNCQLSRCIISNKLSGIVIFGKETMVQ